MLGDILDGKVNYFLQHVPTGLQVRVLLLPPPSPHLPDPLQPLQRHRDAITHRWGRLALSRYPLAAGLPLLLPMKRLDRLLCQVEQHPTILRGLDCQWHTIPMREEGRQRKDGRRRGGRRGTRDEGKERASQRARHNNLYESYRTCTRRYELFLIEPHRLLLNRNKTNRGVELFTE